MSDPLNGLKITGFQMKLSDPHELPLLAYFSVEFNGVLVVRDCKLLNAERGPFVAMPSRVVQGRCSCGTKNSVRSHHCTRCGAKLTPAPRGEKPSDIFRDIAFPLIAGPAAGDHRGRRRRI
jgi:hypothetical protein